MSGDFLSRWSRRKREAAEPGPGPAPEAMGDEPGAAAPPTTATDAATDAEIDALSAEEIAALPTPDQFRLDTDLTQFLRRGVPPGLRNAALRRMWSLDPGIRDYLCEAREYAYDWNVPGGVPGYGPLLPTDDVGDLLRQVIGRPSEEAGAAGPKPADRHDVAPAGLDASGSDAGPPSRAGEEANPWSAAPEPAPPDTAEGGAGTQDVAAHPLPVAGEATARACDEGSEAGRETAQARHKSPPLSPVRRHGGAIPI